MTNPFPIYSTPATSERERLVRLMARRDALPAHLRRFPEPPPYLSPRELDIWDDLRGAFSGTGAVGSDQVAVVEVLVTALASGDRLRGLLNGIQEAATEERAAIRLAVEQADATVLRVLEFVGVTHAMRTYLWTRSRGALTQARVGLVEKRSGHARPPA